VLLGHFQNLVRFGFLVGSCATEEVAAAELQGFQCAAFDPSSLPGAAIVGHPINGKLTGTLPVGRCVTLTIQRRDTLPERTGAIASPKLRTISALFFKVLFPAYPMVGGGGGGAGSLTGGWASGPQLVAHHTGRWCQHHQTGISRGGVQLD